MRKIVFSMIAVLATAIILFAEMQVVDKGSFQATGVAATTTIPAGDGKIVDTVMNVYFGTNKTVSIYLPSIAATVQAAASSSTNMALYTEGSNTVAGYTLTTSDYLLVRSSTAYTLSKLVSIDLGSNVTHYTVATAVTCAAKDTAYIVKSADILTYVGLSTNVNVEVRNAFVGYKNMPVKIAVGASGSPDTSVTGTYSLEK